MWRFFIEPKSSTAAQGYAYFSLFVIIVSIFTFIAQTHSFFPRAGESAHIEDIRIAAEHKHNSRSKWKGLRRRPITVIEILALLPDIADSLIRVITSSNYEYEKVMEGLHFLKLLRVMRILRLMRQVPGLWILCYTLGASVVCGHVDISFHVDMSFYYAERHAQSDFSSIPKCLWWAVITMSTVGYGDMFPVTPWGYLVGSFTSVVGVLMVGLAVPVLVNNFVMYYSHTTSTAQRDKRQSASARRRRGGFNFSSLGTFGKKMSLAALAAG
ncbi:hypothetical protein RRG08_036097 [Elysia crispata]|uniref:Ion transport domain-containing protein n=1 Tax=Elysia crispata TaxID=231223 RepID=A0AAE1AL32_9GAST|nr:hypothetical protein RRG08_036097 [Elysia crispata]